MTEKKNRGPAEGPTIQVRQIRSGIGFARTQKATLVALGLGRIGKVRTHPDNPQVRGMINKVRHLVVIEGATALGAGAGR